MVKIGKLYILSEAEIEELCIERDRLYAYKALAEIREKTDDKEDGSNFI